MEKLICFNSLTLIRKIEGAKDCMKLCVAKNTAKNTRYLATIISTTTNIKRKSKALQSHAVISLSI